MALLYGDPRKKQAAFASLYSFLECMRLSLLLLLAAAALFGRHQRQLLQPSYVDSLPATLQGASGRVQAAEASSLID